MTNPQLSVQRFIDLGESELQAWNRLVEEYPSNRRAFLSPAYCRAVASHFPDVRVLVFRAAGQSVAFLPIQSGEGLLKLGGVHEPVGGVMADYFGLVAKPGFSPQIAEVLKQSRINAIAFTHLDETQSAFGLTGEQPRIGLRTHIAGSGKDFWDSLRAIDKKLVNDTERRERKLLTECGALSFELNSSNPEADLEELIQLKQSQYDRTGKRGAPLFEDRNMNLLRTLRGNMDPSCTGLLSILRVNGELVAAHFGLKCHEILHFWFPVYAVRFHSYSPGRILFKYVVHEGAAQGIRIIDRGEGDTPAKRDFANEEHRYYRGVWSQSGVPGLFGRAALSLSWRLEAYRNRATT